MNLKDLGPALKETISNGGALIDAVSGTAIFAAAEAFLNIKDTYSKVKIERNIKAFLDGLKDGDKDKLQTAINRIFQETNEDDFPILLLETFERSVRPLRAELLAGLVLALSNNEIEMTTFEKCSLVVTESQTTALSSLEEFYHMTAGTSYWTGKLLSPHPVESMLFSLGVAERYGSQLRITHLGETIYKYGFRGTVTNPRPPTAINTDLLNLNG